MVGALYTTIAAAAPQSYSVGSYEDAVSFAERAPVKVQIMEKAHS